MRSGATAAANPTVLMKARSLLVLATAAFAMITGCTTTDSELSQKEKDKIARDMERANQKEAQAQAKMMRETTQGTQRRGTR